MKSFILLSILCTVTAAQAKSLNRHVRALGGQPVSIEDFPYQVSISHQGNHTCGGAIISPRYVLTAANCVVRNPASQYTIRSGTKYKNHDGELRQVDKIVVHEKYHMAMHLYDIAVVRVEKPFVFNPKTQPIQLFQKDEKPETSEAVFTGFGSHDKTQKLPDDLVAVCLRIYFYDYCEKKLLYQFYKQSQTCAGDLKHNIRDSDFGGPLVVEGKLYGVAVDWFRPQRFIEWGPATFTEVASVRDWIDENAELTKES